LVCLLFGVAKIEAFKQLKYLLDPVEQKEFASTVIVAHTV
jgi:hypothetical protein